MKVMVLVWESHQRITVPSIWTERKKDENKRLHY
jgi:hypothetical protein